MDEFSTALSSLLNNWLQRLFGPDADNTVFGSVTWADLGVMLCFVLLVLLVNAIAAALVQRKLKQTSSSPVKGRQLQHHIFGALGKPFYVLIWIYGIYFAITPLLLKLKPDEGLNIVRNFFDKMLDLGVFMVLFWLFFRFTRVLEARLAV
jgi:hypothetical protein